MRQYYRQPGEKERIVKSTETAASRVRKIESRESVRMPDYRWYQMSASEYIKYLGMYGVLDASISYLFFYSWIAFFILLPGAVMFLREQRNSLRNKQTNQIQKQFLDGIQMMSASLQVGYSVENALKEAHKELQKVYSQDSVIVKEFGFMSVQVSMNRNLEELFLDFGNRTGIEDIQSFAEVFLTAKRTGGDLIAIIRNTAFCIRQKQETMLEIETCLAGKMLEQKIMSMVPILILAYVKLTSPEFLESMYGNLTGTAIMVICFLVYATAYFWGKRIIQIEV